MRGAEDQREGRREEIRPWCNIQRESRGGHAGYLVGGIPFTFWTLAGD
jgi:hypothetical protein